MNIDYTTIQKMGDIFCDYQLVPKGCIKNYYLLVKKIMGTNKIPQRSIIFKELDRCISMLKKQERKFLTLKYGLQDKNEKTLKTISEQYGVTSERVRQVVEAAIRNLSQNKSQYYVLHKMEILESKKKQIEEEIEYYSKLITNSEPVEITIHDLGFSTRAYNCLKRYGIISYEQLMNLTPIDIMNMRSSGIKTANEIWLKLHGEKFPYGLTS